MIQLCNISYYDITLVYQVLRHMIMTLNIRNTSQVVTEVVG